METMLKPDTSTAYDYFIKVIGKCNTDFTCKIIDTVKKSLPKLPDKNIMTKTSKDGKFVSITFNIAKEYDAEVKSIYREFHKNKEILLLL